MPEKINASELIEKCLAECKRDLMAFFYVFFENHKRLATPKFHLEMLDATLGARFLAVASPRESAKSTMLVFVKPFHDIIFKKRRFILIISNTFKKAAMSLDTMKKELAENKLLNDLCPGIVIEKDAEGDSEFRHPDGFTTKVLCRGVDQIGSVRGVKFGAYRPDLIIGDDIEDDELVKNPIRRTELQQLFDEALLPAGEKDLCQYIVVGTILHDDSLLSKLISKDRYLDWKKLFFKARQDNNLSLWPEKWSEEWLNELEKNNPTVFAKEYQNDPVAGRNAKFRREDFRVWKQESGDYFLYNEYGEVVSRGELSSCVPAIACDLAWKEKRESDSGVILPGYLTPNSEILIEEYINAKGLKPTDVAEHIFVMVEKLEKATGKKPTIGFEKAMLENVTEWFLKQEMRKRNIFLITKPLVWDSDKVTRIETRLLSRYIQHVIFHRKGMGDLEHQLERFPHGAHDDLIDAEQGLVQLLQFPRSIKHVERSNVIFERLRQHAIDSKRHKKDFHGFGNKTANLPRGIPSKKAFF